MTRLYRVDVMHITTGRRLRLLVPSMSSMGAMLSCGRTLNKSNSTRMSIAKYVPYGVQSWA